MTQYIVSPTLMNHLIDLVHVGDRVAFFLEYLKGKKVLHVGCTDYPRFDPKANLHLQLAAGALKELHGLDLDAVGIDVLRGHVSAPLFSRYEDIMPPYDVVLIPEVIEHVLNPGLFLKQIMEIDTREIMIMAPNAIDIVQNNPGRFGWVMVDNKKLYTETVHKDHCCYYSPMTLATTIEKAGAEYCPGKWTIKGLFKANVSIGCILTR